MAEINKIRRCYNCGAILQCEDPSKEGYVEKEVLENATQNFLFCNHCFELERYRERPNEPILEQEFLTLIADAKKKNALIVYVVNIFSFESSFIGKLNKALEGMNILVVGNKIDLLPAKTDKESIKEYTAHRFRVAGLDISVDNIILCNAFDDDEARDVMTRIYEMKNGKDVYIIGSHLSGKSTLISSFLRVINNFSTGNIVTEPYPGTSLDVMRIPLNSRTTIYDTPGLSLDNSFVNNLDRATIRAIWLNKPVKPRDITISPEHTLFIGGLAMIELVSGEKTTFTCYFNDGIELSRTHRLTSEKSPLDEKFVKLISKNALKPSLHTIKSVKDLDVYEISITESNQRDIGILGLGWVSFAANNQVFRIYLPKGVSMYHSRAKIILEK